MSAVRCPEWTADGRVWFAQAIRGPACLLVVAAHFGQIFLTEQVTEGAVALLYLLHAVCGYVVIRVVFVETGNYYAAAVTALCAALAVAAAIHLLVERPSIALGRRLSRGQGHHDPGLPAAATAAEPGVPTLLGFRR